MELQTHNVKQPASNGVIEDLKAWMYKLSQIATLRGVVIHPPSSAVLSEFAKVKPEKQNKILQNLISTCRINEKFDELEGSSKKSAFEREASLFKRALDEFGLELKDPKFFENVKDDDVLEIYDYEGVQIYRSWNFFKFCSYSLAELLVYDWNTLYERPQSIVNSLIELAPHLFTPDATTMPYNLKDYVLIERYLDKDQVYNVKMKFASPLQDQRSKHTTAFVSTSRINFSLGQTSNLGFI